MRASARPIAGDGDSSHRLRTESIFGIALGFGFTQIQVTGLWILPQFLLRFRDNADSFYY
jgi:hypothetical protein